MKKKLNNIWFGLLAGFVGEFIGLLIVFLWYRQARGMSSWGNFWGTFFGHLDIQSKLLMFALIFNALFFFVMLRTGLDRFANGIVGASVLITVYLVIISVI